MFLAAIGTAGVISAYFFRLITSAYSLYASDPIEGQPVQLSYYLCVFGCGLVFWLLVLLWAKLHEVAKLAKLITPITTLTLCGSLLAPFMKLPLLVRFLVLFQVSSNLALLLIWAFFSLKYMKQERLRMLEELKREVRSKEEKREAMKWKEIFAEERREAMKWKEMGRERREEMRRQKRLDEMKRKEINRIIETASPEFFRRQVGVHNVDGVGGKVDEAGGSGSGHGSGASGSEENRGRYEGNDGGGGAGGGGDIGESGSGYGSGASGSGENSGGYGDHGRGEGGTGSGHGNGAGGSGENRGGSEGGDRGRDGGEAGPESGSGSRHGSGASGSGENSGGYEGHGQDEGGTGSGHGSGSGGSGENSGGYEGHGQDEGGTGSGHGSGSGGSGENRGRSEGGDRGRGRDGDGGDLESQETRTNTEQAFKSSKIAEMSLMITAQTTAALIGFHLTTPSSSSKALLVVVLIDQLVAYLCGLTSILLGSNKPKDSKVAKIFADIGFVCTALGFILMIAMFVPWYLVLIAVLLFGVVWLIFFCNGLKTRATKVCNYLKNSTQSIKNCIRK